MRRGMATRGLKALLVMVVVVVTGATAGRSAAEAAAGADSAREVVERAVQETVTVLRDASLPRTARGRKVGGILEQNFDFETFSRLAVGQASWRAATESQRTEFVREFSKHVVAICRGGTNQYGGQDLTVAEDRREAKGDWTVQTRVVGKKDGTPREVAKIDFRLRQKQRQWKVIDVTISGISMAATFRAQFAGIIQDGGIEKATQILREKNSASEAVADGGDR
jgi:phospholipid transport system substrate-binding protein